MKKTSIITISVLAMTLCASCDNLLNLESETSVTTNYLKTDKDGLKRAIAGLYVYERDNIVDNSDSKGIVILPQLFDLTRTYSCSTPVTGRHWEGSPTLRQTPE